MGSVLMNRFLLILSVSLLLSGSLTNIHASDWEKFREHAKAIDKMLLDRNFDEIFMAFERTPEYSRFNDTMEIYIRAVLGEIESMEDDLIADFRSKYSSFSKTEDVLQGLEKTVEVMATVDDEKLGALNEYLIENPSDSSEFPEDIDTGIELLYLFYFGHRQVWDGLSHNKLVATSLAVGFQRDPEIWEKRQPRPEVSETGRIHNQDEGKNFDEEPSRTTDVKLKDEITSDAGSVESANDQIEENE